MESEVLRRAHRWVKLFINPADAEGCSPIHTPLWTMEMDALNSETLVEGPVGLSISDAGVTLTTVLQTV